MLLTPVGVRFSLEDPAFWTPPMSGTQERGKRTEVRLPGSRLEGEIQERKNLRNRNAPSGTTSDRTMRFRLLPNHHCEIRETAKRCLGLPPRTAIDSESNERIDTTSEFLPILRIRNHPLVHTPWVFHRLSWNKSS